MKQINTHSVIPEHSMVNQLQNENPLSDRMDCVFDVVMENTQPESVKNVFCAAYVTLINIAPQCMKRETLNSLIAGKMERFGH